MRTTGPQEDRVDRVRRGLDAHIAERDLHVVRTGGLVDLVEHIGRQPLGRFELRPGRGTEPQLELTHAARGEDLAPERETDRHDDADGDGRIGRHQDPARWSQELQEPPEAIPEPVNPVLRVRVSARSRSPASQEPDGQHRHERAREEERRDHREADREREWHKQRARHARHEEGRDEHGDDREHGEESRHHHFPARVQHTFGDRDATRQVRVDVFDGDGRFIDQNADRQRKAAERHDIDGLARAP